MNVIEHRFGLAATTSSERAVDCHEVEFSAGDLMTLGDDCCPKQAVQRPRGYDGQTAPVVALEALELEQTLVDLERLVWPELLPSQPTAPVLIWGAALAEQIAGIRYAPTALLGRWLSGS